MKKKYIYTIFSILMVCGLHEVPEARNQKSVKSLKSSSKGKSSGKRKYQKRLSSTSSRTRSKSARTQKSKSSQRSSFSMDKSGTSQISQEIKEISKDIKNVSKSAQTLTRSQPLNTTPESEKKSQISENSEQQKNSSGGQTKPSSPSALTQQNLEILPFEKVNIKEDTAPLPNVSIENAQPVVPVPVVNLVTDKKSILPQENNNQNISDGTSNSWLSKTKNAFSYLGNTAKHVGGIPIKAASVVRNKLAEHHNVIVPITTMVAAGQTGWPLLTMMAAPHIIKKALGVHEEKMPKTPELRNEN